MLCSHLTYFPVQKERLLERKARYCCCLPSPCSNLLFVNAALTPEPSGAEGILPTSGCNTCSVWESWSQLSSNTFGQAGSAATVVNPRWKLQRGDSGQRRGEDADRVQQWETQQVHPCENKNQKYGTEWWAGALSEATWWGAAGSGSAEVRPSASLERNEGGACTLARTHTHASHFTQVKSCFWQRSSKNRTAVFIR